jgi:hypothetical protein
MNRQLVHQNEYFALDVPSKMNIRSSQ